MTEQKEEPNEFGLTNDSNRMALAAAYMQAAVADGWSLRATYEGEPAEVAGKLEKEGFTMSILRREHPPHLKYRYTVSIHIWGPDEMTIRPPDQYDWGAIKAGLTTCNCCGKHPVTVERYSFAGRACNECLPAMRAERERPGWTL